MNELSREGLIRLLSEPTQVTNEEMQKRLWMLYEKSRNYQPVRNRHSFQTSILSLNRKVWGLLV